MPDLLTDALVVAGFGLFYAAGLFHNKVLKSQLKAEQELTAIYKQTVAIQERTIASLFEWLDAEQES